MKRFIICFDGTWQSLRQDKLTNIGVIARSVAHKIEDAEGKPVEQVVIYSRGVGTGVNALDREDFLGGVLAGIARFFGGAFGSGAEDQIVDAYLRLAFNFEAGDEIYVFGFSRGAFAARSFAGMINCSGIISRMHAEKAWEAFRLYQKKLPKRATEADRAEFEDERRQFRMLYGKGARAADRTRIKVEAPPPIKYLGIFDTVVQRGFWSVLLGLDRLAERFSFHNLNISPNVENARHAIAVDEYRRGFPLRLWDDLADANKRAGRPDAYQQRWFVGTHGDIGGGEGSMLSAAPLKWVAQGAAQSGLRFYGTYGRDESDLHRTLREAGIDSETAFAIREFDHKISRPKLWNALSPHNWYGRPRVVWSSKDAPTAADAEISFDTYVIVRAAAARVRPRYLPAPLRPYKSILRQLAARHLSAEELIAEREKRFFFF